MSRSDKKKDPNLHVLRNEAKRDWATFKRLKGMQRVRFLWDYYKIPFALAALLIVTVAVFGVMLYQGRRPCRLRVCAVLNTDDSCAWWFNQFEKELEQDGIPGGIELNEDQPFDYSNPYYYMYETEVMTTIGSYRMDVAVCNADMYSYVLALNACMPLDEALPESFFEDLDERGMLDYNTANLQIDEEGNTNPEDGIDGCYAVNLEGTQFAEMYNQTDDDEPLYVVIISNTDNLEDAVTLVEALCE